MKTGYAWECKVKADRPVVGGKIFKWVRDTGPLSTFLEAWNRRGIYPAQCNVHGCKGHRIVKVKFFGAPSYRQLVYPIRNVPVSGEENATRTDV